VAGTVEIALLDQKNRFDNTIRIPALAVIRRAISQRNTPIRVRIIMQIFKRLQKLLKTFKVVRSSS
jgi:hypothetical protein